MNSLYLLMLNLLPLTWVNAQQLNKNTDFNKEPAPDSITYIGKLISDGQRAGTNDTAYSLSALRKAVALARSLHNDILTAKAFCAIGDIYFQENTYNRALPNYSRAADLYYETDEHRQFVYSMLCVAKSQYYRGNYSRAAETFVNVVKSSKRYGLPEITGEANEYLGLIYGAFQNFQRSSRAWLKSLEIKQELRDEKGIVRVAGNLSQLYYQSRQYDSALIFANASFEAAKKTGMPTDMYMAEFTKTAALISLRKIQLAEKELQFFEQNKHKHQDANLRIRYQTLLGNYYLAKNQENLSLKHYDSAFAVLKRNSFPELLIILYSNMAESYYQIGDIHKAFDYSKKYNSQLSEFYSGNNLTKLANLEGLTMLDATKDEIKHLSRANQLKALLLRQEQDARKILARENVLKDSILNKEKLLNSALERENRYKQEKLSDEKALSSSISRENLLQKEKLSYEKQLRISLLTGLCLLITLSVLIFLMYKRQRRKSTIIQKQSDELKTLMKEIHHRVKNNLQIISSLLDLQSLSIKNKHASGLVKEGKLRVQSMALIHQNLYNEGNIKGILMKDYINNLVENLFHSYNIQENKIRLVTDIEHINLDVDTVIPLGLIINELINNSLKYAFKEKEQGEIFVALKENDKKLTLYIKDNGCGFPPTWSNRQTNTFGYKLINAFAQKLKASLDVYNDSGACICMNISKYKLA